MRAPSYASLDDALELLVPYGIALTNGNSNHAPMVAEALCALGATVAVIDDLSGGSTDNLTGFKPVEFTGASILDQEALVSLPEADPQLRRQGRLQRRWGRLALTRVAARAIRARPALRMKREPSTLQT